MCDKAAYRDLRQIKHAAIIGKKGSGKTLQQIILSEMTPQQYYEHQEKIIKIVEEMKARREVEDRIRLQNFQFFGGE